MTAATPTSGERPGAGDVSVVIPCYNGSRFLAEALASVRAQTRAPLEVLVIDDGSRPEEAAAIDAVVAASGLTRCRALHLPANRGVSVARNVGIEAARGTWVAFLDCDDAWLPAKLERQLAYLAAHPRHRAVHAGIRSIHADGREVDNEKAPLALEDMVHFPCPILPSALIVERMALIECGLFDPTLRVCQDVALCLRLATQFPIGAVPDVLVIRHVHAEGLSRNEKVFYDEAERVYRDFRFVFKDEAAAIDNLVDLSADFLLRALYARDAGFFWRVLRRTRPDVGLVALAGRVLGGLVRNRREASRP